MVVSVGSGEDEGVVEKASRDRQKIVICRLPRQTIRTALVSLGPIACVGPNAYRGVDEESSASRQSKHLGSVRPPLCEVIERECRKRRCCMLNKGSQNLPF